MRGQTDDESAERNRATPETLSLAYEDRVREAERLRDARRAFTTQLGVLPASAALVVGLFAASAADINERLLALALIPFALVVAIGLGFGCLKPYRNIRREIELEVGRADWRRLSPEQWLVTMIKLEERIYSELELRLKWERRGVLVVQGLVVVQVVYVIALAAFWSG